MSESVFDGLCRKVRTSSQVVMRREVVDFIQLFRNVASETLESMYSGSFKDGFRLDGSDVDVMHWSNDIQVIWDLDQAQSYFTNRKWIVLCDFSESPPGFTLLQLLMPTNIDGVEAFFVRINDKLYISSSKLRQHPLGIPNMTEHGPCNNLYRGGTEFDFALCFRCRFWPPSASSWIDRCHFWPQAQIVQDIVKNGCHLVAIGHKLGNHEDNEWRISFSLAEQKLVYSMNHSQFLTYGLLKIFLKEILNSASDAQANLLCSYHVKTAFLWVIQQNTIPQWCPQNLLECFWVCFKFLLKCVYEGVCPNFLLPENNMFLTNIHGQAQKELFYRLFELYKKGIAFLLHSPSIRPYIINVLYNPTLSTCTDENNLITEIIFDFDFFNETFMHDILLLPNLHSYINILHTVEHLIASSLTEYQVVVLQRFTVYVLQTTAFLLFNKTTNTCSNKLIYTANKMVLHMLTLAANFGCISDMLFIAIYYYQTSRYMKALSFIDMTKIKLLQQPQLTCGKMICIDPEAHSDILGGKSLSTKLRHARAEDILLRNDIFYINELIPEQSGLESSFTYTNLCFPLLLMINMLEMLSSIHTDAMRAQRALNALHALIHYDQGKLVPEHLRNISWQILGICQQIVGNIPAALFSYQQSLRETAYLKIQTATLMRIQGIKRTIQHDYTCDLSTGAK